MTNRRNPEPTKPPATHSRAGLSKSPAKKDPVSGPEWERLATAIRERRTSLGIGVREASRRCSVSVTMLNQLETQSLPFTPSALKLRSLSRGLGWTEDSAERVLAGKKVQIPTADQEEQLVLDGYSADLRRLRTTKPAAFEMVMSQVRRLLDEG